MEIDFVIGSSGPLWPTPNCAVFRDIRNERGTIIQTICGDRLYVFSHNKENFDNITYGFKLKKFKQKVDPPQA